MTDTLSTDQVWEAVEKELFAVLGMVTAAGESRTAGIVYIVENRTFYISTGKASWKARHIAGNPHVSLTIPIAKRVPLMPWIKVPAATITCSGTARVLDTNEMPQPVLKAIFRDSASDPAVLENSVIIEVVPRGDFVTYGVGVSLMEMRDTAAARGRVPVSNR